MRRWLVMRTLVSTLVIAALTALGCGGNSAPAPAAPPTTAASSSSGTSAEPAAEPTAAKKCPPPVDGPEPCPKGCEQLGAYCVKSRGLVPP